MDILVKNKIIGEKHPVFVVAELSGNHNQNYDIAVKTIEAIAKSGADAVKLQTYTPDTITLSSNNKYFQIKHGTIWDGTTMYKLFKTAYTPWDWQPKLKIIAEKLGLICFSSPFDKSAVDFLEKMDCPIYKIASPEIVDIPLIEYIALKNKPVFISTGVATLSDIKEAVRTCHRCKNYQIALLKCTSAYPTPMDEINLKVIPDLVSKFKTIVGISDHTLGDTVSIGAVSIGAKIVEKHFILDRNIGGPDASFSMNTEEFTQMVKNIRVLEKALGKVTYNLTPKVKITKKFQRSLFAVKSIIKGERFNFDNIKSIRPGNGLPPKYLPKIIGKKSLKNISKGTPLSWNCILRNEK